MENNILYKRLKMTSRYLPEHFSTCPPEDLPQMLQGEKTLLETYPFLVELARVELLLEGVNARDVPDNSNKYQIAPGVELVQAGWSGFCDLLNDKETTPEKKEELLLVIPQAEGERAVMAPADNDSLLALKIVAESLEIRELANQLDVPVAYLQDVLRYGVAQGLLIAPVSRMTRPAGFAMHTTGLEDALQTNTFTLQWHITQSCELNCRHCYDRSERKEVGLEEGRNLLDQLYSFCSSYHVQGQVTFTGGNPILHPQFEKLYRAACERGFRTALLANPTKRSVLETLKAIQMPEFYQISLEGLEEHNDYIRGRGHFQRSLQFLDLLKDLDIYSMVMLTLTRANINQVLPLAEILRDRVDSFTFNRLSMVGEGASLASVDPGDYRSFLADYRKAAEKNPVMRLKDNLFNLLHYQQELPLMSGCTGYGCGAAFNFVSVLPDGQVNACRKFPSPIGDLNEQDLITIYESDLAIKYRKGTDSCFQCRIKPLCGGCPAVSYGFNKEPLQELDPYCFLDQYSIQG